MTSTQETTTDVQSSRMLGQVKWFNNKAGYGFITASEGEHTGKDIFIHYSTIRVTNSQYKYLVQGEYVEFTLIKSNTDQHEYQASEVSGIKGGSLMCEARRTTRPGGEEGAAPNPAPVRRPRVRRDAKPADSSAPSSSAQDGEFTTVRRRRPQGKKPANKAPVESA